MFIETRPQFPAQTTAALNSPFGMAYNPVNGEVYVTNAGNGTVTAYSYASPLAQDTTATFILPAGGTKPAGIAIVY